MEFIGVWMNSNRFLVLQENPDGFFLDEVSWN